MAPFSHFCLVPPVIVFNSSSTLLTFRRRLSDVGFLLGFLLGCLPASPCSLPCAACKAMVPRQLKHAAHDTRVKGTRQLLSWRRQFQLERRNARCAIQLTAATEVLHKRPAVGLELCLFSPTLFGRGSGVLPSIASPSTVQQHVSRQREAEDKQRHDGANGRFCPGAQAVCALLSLSLWHDAARRRARAGSSGRVDRGSC